MGTAIRFMLGGQPVTLEAGILMLVARIRLEIIKGRTRALYMSIQRG
jgi:hypothetical protein